MARSGRVPAGRWRAFFLAGSVAVATILRAGPPTTAQRPPELAQTGTPDPAEVRQVLEQLRHQGVAGEYFLEFRLRVRPRRGDERIVDGRLWGARNADGPLTRVSVGEGTEERRLLVQNGPHSAAWRWSAADGRVEQLGVDALFDPLVPDTDITAFDLQMPFLFWENYTYQGLDRFAGRPAYAIVLRPPAEFAAKHPGLTGVRVHLDSQYNALVQTELLGPGDAVTKTMSLVDLKKVGEQWIPRTFDLRDERTRDKTRFEVTAAALGLDFAPTVFEPGELVTRIAPPAAPLTRF